MGKQSFWNYISTMNRRKVMVKGVSECWMFYAVLTAKVIFIVKTSLGVFSLRREQVWTFSVLGD